MSDIFISYKREERLAALSLSTALEGVGWTVWWDLELVGGERFDDAIEAELHEARCVVVLWSKRSVQSDFVKDEANRALKQGKLLPARIDDTEVPLRFERLHTIDLSGQGQLHDASGFGELVEHITKRIGEPAGGVKSGIAVDEAAPNVSPAVEEKKQASTAAKAGELAAVISPHVPHQTSRQPRGIGDFFQDIGSKRVPLVQFGAAKHVILLYMKQYATPPECATRDEVAYACRHFSMHFEDNWNHCKDFSWIVEGEPGTFSVTKLGLDEACEIAQKYDLTKQ